MFPIIKVPDTAPILLEHLGTKRKFWFDNYRFLFKEARENTGEDWAEKIACEVCTLLKLPHADYDLATWKTKRGVVTKSFAHPDEGQRLVMGNELLFRLNKNYPVKEIRGVRQHTIRSVLAVTSLEFIKPPLGFELISGVENASEVFVGYLLLDAWIANQDRHHQNWGLVVLPGQVIHLAPSFDHASSMGPFELDEARAERLITKDKCRSIERYVEKARSAFYSTEVSEKPYSTLDAFMAAARFRPKAALSWLKQLENVSMQEVEAIFDRISSDKMSDISKKFALRILTLNRERLLNSVRMLLE